jgi:hypothetical protein
MSTEDNNRFIDESVRRSELLARQDVFVGVSPESFAVAARNGWEAAKRKGVTGPITFRISDQYVTCENPITEFEVVLRPKGGG